MKSPMLIFFSLKKSTMRKIPSFLSPQQPQTFRENCLCILAMFMMSRKDLKHVNRQSLAVKRVSVLKYVAR